MGEWIDGGDLNSLTWVVPAAFLKVLLFHTCLFPAPGMSSIPAPQPHQDLSYTCGFFETTTFGGSCTMPRSYSPIWKSSASQQTLVPHMWNKPLPFTILKYQTTHNEPRPVPLNNQLANHRGPTGVWMTRSYISSMQH